MIQKIKQWVLCKKVSKEIKLFEGYKLIDGWLTEFEAYGLYKIASKISKNGQIVEIGSWKGKSTFCLAKGLKNGTIYAIDPFNADGENESKNIYDKQKGVKPLMEQFITNMKHQNLIDKIKILKGYSSQFLHEFSQIDFLFIDGDHSIEGCDYDFINYSPFLKKGGYIAFHDFYPDRNDLGPTWVIKNRINNNPSYKFHRQYDSLWIAQKLK